MEYLIIYCIYSHLCIILFYKNTASITSIQIMNELDSWRYNILWKYIYVSRVFGQAVLRAITIPVPYA